MGLLAHPLPLEPTSDATLQALADHQVFALLARIGSRRVALPAMLIERVFPVAAWVPIAAGAVVGFCAQERQRDRVSRPCQQRLAFPSGARGGQTFRCRNATLGARIERGEGTREG